MGFLLRPDQREFVLTYLSAIRNTPEIFRRLAFRRRTLEEELQEALLRGSLRKAFSSFDLLMLGLGIVIASGWIQLTGMAAQDYAGPAIVISYCFAGLAALLSAACYAELCLEYPVSGGSFSYVMVTFGEFAAFVALAGLLLEYALGMAAVARGFSSNLAALINLNPGDIRLEANIWGDPHSFDLVAAGIILVMSLLLSLGVRESALVISAMTVVKLALLVVVAIVGYTRGAWDNPDGIPITHWRPFTGPQWDLDGMFMGASTVFFSLTGWDAIGNAAEEVQHVASLPKAILGTVLIATSAYVMLAISLVVMTWPNIVCPDPSLFKAGTCSVGFISAFLGHGYKFMQYVTALAALFGIMTALTVGLFSVSRIVMVAARDWLLPPFLARVSRRTQTPLLAQMVFGVLIALLALLVEVDAATALVSFGTLISLWLVCNAQLYRRYFPDVQLRFTRYGTVETAPTQALHRWALGRNLSQRARKALVWAHLAAINATVIGLAAYYSATATGQVLNRCPAPPPPPPSPGSLPADQQPGAPLPLSWPYSDPTLAACDPSARDVHHGLAPVYFIVAWAAATLSLHLLCPLEYEPDGWHIPRCLMPWLPSAAIAMLIFSLGALPHSDYWKIGIYFISLLAFYLLFSLPMSYIKHSRVDYSNKDELNVVELVLVDGRWQASRPANHTAIASAASVRSFGTGAGSSPELSVKTLPGSGPMAKQIRPLSAGSVPLPAGSAAVGSRPGSVTAAGPGRPDSVTVVAAGRHGGAWLGGRGSGRSGRGGGGVSGAAAQPTSTHSPRRAQPVLPPMQEGSET